MKKATGTSVTIYGLHRRLGISAMTLGLFQLTALIYRSRAGRGGGRACPDCHALPLIASIEHVLPCLPASHKHASCLRALDPAPAGHEPLRSAPCRPHKGTRARPYWEFMHHWVGRAAAVVAVANIYE